jgi:conflict system STAND superfamily ATPase
MLSGQEVPGIRASGIRLQMQASSLGWEVDDLLVTTAGTGPVCRLAISCKSSVQVTPSGLPTDFTRAAWRQLRKHGSMGPDDAIALATRGRDAAFDQTWADIKGWCAGPSTELPAARITASTKHNKVFARIKRASAKEGALADDGAVVQLIQRLHVLPFDFQLVPSHNESDAIERCRRLLREESGAEGKRLWEALLRRAEKARLGDGTIELDELWSELSAEFDLKDHPNFAPSWRALSALSNDHVGTIDLELPSGFRAARTEAADKLAAQLQQGALAVVIGESGTGKSAMVRATLGAKFGGWQQVWLKPDVLEELLSEAKRGQLGLTHALLDVLKAASRPTNVLVIDSAERLSGDGAKPARKLIEELVRATSGAWRVVIIGQRTLRTACRRSQASRCRMSSRLVRSLHRSSGRHYAHLRGSAGWPAMMMR